MSYQHPTFYTVNSSRTYNVPIQEPLVRGQGLRVEGLTDTEFMRQLVNWAFADEKAELIQLLEGYTSDLDIQDIENMDILGVLRRKSVNVDSSLKDFKNMSIESEKRDG